MPGAGPDPFELVKTDIQDSLARAQTDYDQWQSGKSVPGKRQELANGIEDECKSMAWQVRSAQLTASSATLQCTVPLSPFLCTSSAG